MVRQADDPFVCFGAKPDKEFGLEISTRPEVGRERQSETWKKEPRRATEKGGRHRPAEETSRREIESSNSEGRPVNMSWHS